AFRTGWFGRGAGWAGRAGGGLAAAGSVLAWASGSGSCGPWNWNLRRITASPPCLDLHPGSFRPRHGFVDGLALLGRQPHLGFPVLDDLGVGPGLQPPADRREDEPAAVVVHQRRRERQAAAHVLEGVVADHGDVPDRRRQVGVEVVLAL